MTPTPPVPPPSHTHFHASLRHCSSLQPHPVWSRRGPSACNKTEQEIRALAEPLCLRLRSLPAHRRTAEGCSRGHTCREVPVARTHLRADRRAGGRHNPFHHPCGERGSAHIVVRAAKGGCTSLLSSGSRTSPEAGSLPPEITHRVLQLKARTPLTPPPPTQQRPFPSRFFFLFIFFLPHSIFLS